MNQKFRSGFVAIMGRPNVGKSSLMNRFVGEKVAIVSKKPQTTRGRIAGVLTEGEDQYVFLDTPGLHKPHNLLGEYMMKTVGTASEDADAVMFVVDASKKLNTAETEALDAYAQNPDNVILIINKTDITDKDQLLRYIADISSKYTFRSVIPVSAKTGDGLDIVRNEIKEFLIESPHFFPDDMYTDQPERQVASEVIREKILRLTDDEIPHGIAVVIEDFTDENTLIKIRAEIYCERAAHKKIIIGKGGEMLKKIGTYAREDLEVMFGCKVYLDLWVRVKENWRDNRAMLQNLGFRDE